MASVAETVQDALNTVNQLVQYSVAQGPNARASNEFARSYKAAMRKLAAAASVLLTAQASLLSNLVNAGAGSGIFKAKMGQLAQLRSLVAGANISLTQTADTIEIAAAGASPSPTVINDIAAVGGIYAVPDSEISGNGLIRITATAGVNFAITLPADPGGAGAFTPGTRVQVIWTGILGVDFDAIISAPGLVSAGSNIAWQNSANGAIATVRYEGNDIWSWEGCPMFIDVV